MVDGMEQIIHLLATIYHIPSTTYQPGEVAEWLKAHAWKACMVATSSQVQILSSPPIGFLFLTSTYGIGILVKYKE